MSNSRRLSDAYRAKIHNLIPGGAHTYSKGDDQFPENAPAAISKGKGAWVWDVDGNRFLDCSMGLTSVGLGHAYEPILDRVKEELDRGVNFQRPSYIEGEMAEAFLSLLPGHDMIKFSKNGSTATSAAVKLARAYTGRKLIVYPAEHPFYSYDDWFIGKTLCSRGIPAEVSALTLTYPCADLQALEKLFEAYPNQIAGVISEPERLGEGPSKAKALLALCEKNGSLFICDEMITGYKCAFPGSMTKQNLVPHLATWGKGIANGFSFCALTGIKEVMELGGIRKEGNEKVFLMSTTHGGETHAIAAALATLNEYKAKNVVAHNQEVGDELLRRLHKLIHSAGLSASVKLSDTNWLLGFSFFDKNGAASAPLRTLFMQEMIEQGVLFQGAFAPCYSHNQAEINFFTKAFEEALSVYAKALERGFEPYLRGAPAKPVFRKYL